MVTETKVIELVIVADHSEVSLWALQGLLPWPPPVPSPFTVTALDPQVQRYADLQRLLNRTLEVALLLDSVSAGPGGTLAAPRPRERPP